MPPRTTDDLAADDAALPKPADDAAQDTVPDTTEDVVDPVDAPEPEPAVDTPAEPVASRRPGFVPLVLGGVIAALIGAGAAWFVLPQVPGLLPAPDNSALEARITAADTAAAQAQDALAAQQAQLAALQQALANIPDPQDALGALESQLATLDTRLAEVEARPLPDAALSPETQAAIDTALRDIRGQIEAELTTLRSAQAEAEAEIAAAASDASATQARALLAQLRANFDSGLPYGDILPQIAAHADIAPVLRDLAETGAPTLQALQQAFPAAARLALERSASVDADASTPDRIGAFLRNQLGVRSLAPREGNDPDAILSRAEAALAAGDIATALQEIDTLPTDAQAPLADWAAQAQARLAAERAIADAAAQFSE